MADLGNGPRGALASPLFWVKKKDRGKTWKKGRQLYTLSRNGSQKTSKCGKNNVTHLPAVLHATFFSYHSFTSSVMNLVPRVSHLPAPLSLQGEGRQETLGTRLICDISLDRRMATWNLFVQWRLLKLHTFILCTLHSNRSKL